MRTEDIKWVRVQGSDILERFDRTPSSVVTKFGSKVSNPERLSLAEWRDLGYYPAEHHSELPAGVRTRHVETLDPTTQTVIYSYFPVELDLRELRAEKLSELSNRHAMKISAGFNYLGQLWPLGPEREAYYSRKMVQILAGAPKIVVQLLEEGVVHMPAEEYRQVFLALTEHVDELEYNYFKAVQRVHETSNAEELNAITL